MVKKMKTTHKKLQHIFFPRCCFYNDNRAVLIKDLENIDQSLPALTEINLVDLLLSDNVNFNDKKITFY